MPSTLNQPMFAQSLLFTTGIANPNAQFAGGTAGAPVPVESASTEALMMLASAMSRKSKPQML